MLVLSLVREKDDGTRTRGFLKVQEYTFATIERPWLPNPLGPGGTPRLSCVPAGTYTVIPHYSEKFPNSYALVNHELGVYYQPGGIPEGQKYGRSAILIHVGNYVEDVIGCIAVGTLGGATYVSNSRAAMKQINNLLGRERHKMVISYGS